MSGESTEWAIACRIAQTEFVPASYRNRPEAIFACLLYGRELGLGPMASLQAVNVIKGKPSLSPEAMRARVFAAGHRIDVLEYTDEKVSLHGIRSDGTKANVEWTIEDAKRANLAGGDSWRKYPRAMLVARATSELCRLLFPDVLNGASYSAEELQSIDDDFQESSIQLASAIRSDDRGLSTVPASPEPGFLQPAALTASASSNRTEGTELADTLSDELADLFNRAKALADRGVPVREERDKEGLPLLNDLVDNPDANLEPWNKFLSRLEREQSE